MRSRPLPFVLISLQVAALVFFSTVAPLTHLHDNRTTHAQRHDAGAEHVPGIRFDFACNWLQVKENAIDPLHTHTLHVIPQLRGMDHFVDGKDRPDFSKGVFGQKGWLAFVRPEEDQLDAFLVDQHDIKPP